MSESAITGMSLSARLRAVVVLGLGLGLCCLSTQAQTPAIGLAGGLSINNIQFNPVINTVSTIPIGGYQPLVATSLTNEETNEELEFYAYPTTTYLNNNFGGDTGAKSGSHALASNASPHYQVALLDSGAQVHLFTDEAIAAFDFAGNNLLGTEQIPIGGVGGSEFITIHDPIGVYATGFANATGGASLSLNTSTLFGHYNVSVTSADDPASILPNVVGLPLMSQFATVIRTDQRKEIVVGSDEFESPNIEFFEFNDPGIPNYANKATLFLQPSSAFVSLPAFFPNLDIFGIDDFHDNPSIPTSSPGAFFLSGDVYNDGNHVSVPEMFFDSGAQVTVLSVNTAINLGINLLAEPEFTVEIQGAGGSVEEVPGYYVDTFSLDTTGGFVLNDVPVLVLDVPDPRDGINPVPAIVGTNLFGDRNIVIHPMPVAGQSYLSISDIVTLVGDLNSDGFVGIADLNIVLSHWNQDVTEGYLFSGDPSGDGFVGIEDLNLVLGNWNAGTPPVAVIPEPATWALLTAAGLVTLRRRPA